jgi:glycosyltransferase involved in cell wall biosynthesis
MKLAIISLMQGFPWGGSEELWFETALYAQQKKHEVQIFVKHWEIKNEKISHLENQGIKINFYKEPVKKNSFLQDFLLRKLQFIKPPLTKWGTCIQKLKEFSPDLMLINQGGTFDLARETELVVFLKTHQIPYFLICEYLPDFYINFPERIRAKATEILQNAKEVYFVSERNKKTTERLLTQKLPQAKVVNNPVNLIKQEIIPYPSTLNCFNLACVARLEIAYKGQDYLLEVLSDKKWKDRNWILNLFGTGPDKDLINKQIKYFGLDDKVKLAGQVNDIASIWIQHHILVLPSIGEGTPLVLAEAMLCGRTAVVTSAGGNSELIANNKNGFVAACALPEYLDEAMERAWERRNDWKEFGEKAFKTSTERYKNNSGETLFNLISNK